jgi:hypothetical protein
VRRTLLVALATLSPACLSLTSLCPAAAQTERPAALQSLLAYHQAACTAQGGTLAIGSDAVSQAGLNGPEIPAHLLDSSKLICSTAPSMFCGDDVGCELNVFVGEAQHSLVVLDWSLVPDGDRQLLQVTIAGALLNTPEPGTFRMTWDSATAALVTTD